MKKYYVLAAAFAVMALSSCTKERTCTCTYDGESDEIVIESKKSVAKAWCEDEGYEIIEYKVNGVVIDDSEDNSEDDSEKCTLD